MIEGMIVEGENWHLLGCVWIRRESERKESNKKECKRNESW